MAKNPKTAIIAGLRKIWSWYWPAKRQLLEWNRVRKDGVYRLQCNKCKKWFRQDDVNVDHIIPVGLQPEMNSADIGEYCKRLFCDIDNLQILCHECHKEKSAYEASERVKLRKLGKTVRSVRQKTERDTEGDPILDLSKLGKD